MKLIKIAYHRNGVSGIPFWAVIFKDGKKKMLGIQFDDDNCYTAVFDLNLLGEENITFGENSFRGDYYENFIRECIKNYNERGVI